jgi:hypothetical protein
MAAPVGLRSNAPILKSHTARGRPTGGREGASEKACRRFVRALFCGKLVTFEAATKGFFDVTESPWGFSFSSD